MSLAARLASLLAEPELDPGGRGTPLDPQQSQLLRSFLMQIEASIDPQGGYSQGGASGDLRELAGQLAETFQFIQMRKRRQILVRVTRGRLAEHGPVESTLLEVLMPEQQFVLDTIEMVAGELGLEVIAKQHVSGQFLRDRSGRLIAFESNGESAVRETLVRMELRGSGALDMKARLVEELTGRLEIARLVVRSFKRMRSVLRRAGRTCQELAAAAPEQLRNDLLETRAFLRWLCQDNFILFGVSHHTEARANPPAPDPERCYGLQDVPPQELEQAARMMAKMQPPDSGLRHWVTVYKGMEDARIHRGGKVDNILLRDRDARGVEHGFWHVRGMFTFKAVQTPASQIPIIRRRLARYLQSLELKPGSIQHRASAGAFNTIPVEFLFEAPSQEIAALVDLSLRVERSHEAGTHLVVDRGNREALYFLAIPQAAYSEELRRRVAEVLSSALAPDFSDSRVQMGKNNVFMLAFLLTAREQFPPFAREDLDARVRALAGTWEERFLRALEQRAGRDQAGVWHSRYAQAFPREYKLLADPVEAVLDVEHLERLRRREDSSGHDTTGHGSIGHGSIGQGLELEVLCGERDRALKSARLRVYLRKNLYLSTILPIFDNFGLQIIEQAAERVLLGPAEEYFIQTFRVAGVERPEAPLLARKASILEALKVVLDGKVASDVLNRLILQPGMEWRDLDLIRAYVFYLRQLGVPHLLLFVASTLEQNANITRLLVDYYRARFDPALADSREQRLARCQELRASIISALSGVRSSAEDAYIRHLLNLFESTLRTSRYLGRPVDEHRISFKVDSTALTLGSDPKPWREIFVYHLQVEGIHLRGGKIARGGIRWSDRITDYRDEILGLMRTQMVKNVLIVPVGAKGGFILRRPQASVAARREQADAMYKIFIGGLLDLTDNIVDGRSVSPAGVVCYDDDDPYLVVAADKGTAHLSDVANSISMGRGFWLGDAFASGGSNGYDHKALAITALGVWEQVRRHFYEMKKDPGRAPFSVVGIGDMAGDVFGNGMLRSRNIRLLGAFNHQHLFIDPAPDPESSFQERERLFRLKGSTWADYNPALLSPGGGVFDRHAKTLALSPEARAMLALEEREFRPEEVIRALLMLEVDLIWNGGIGTYIKAAAEDNREVGDFSNAEVRVNANKVRARIVAEGGNLGVTQGGRVEYALRGGGINSDFVDNSGGVDCSDHEVNLKILLKPELDAGRMTWEVRNQLLKSLREDVCAAVLADSRAQGLMISLDEVRSRRDLFAFERLIGRLEEAGYLQRERDRLPSLEQMQARHAQGLGMTRPELALLAAYTKMQIMRLLMELPPQTLPRLREHLLAYFPARIVAEYGALVDAHSLGREIALTVLTNHIVDQAGATFFAETARECGVTLAGIVQAYLLVEDLFEARTARRSLAAAEESAPPETAYRALVAIDEAVRRGVVWVLGGGGERMRRLEESGAEYARAQTEWRSLLPAVLSKPERIRFERARDEFAPSLGEALAERVAGFSVAAHGLAVLDLARDLNMPLPLIARFYFETARASQVLSFVRKGEERGFNGRWDSLAFRMLRNEFHESLMKLVAAWARKLGGPAPDWLERATALLREDRSLAELRAEMKRLGAQDDVSIATLQVVATRFERLAASVG